MNARRLAVAALVALSAACGASVAVASPFAPGSSAVQPERGFFVQGTPIGDPAEPVEVASDAPTFYGYTVPSARVVLTDGEDQIAYPVVSDARGYFLTHPLEAFGAGTHRVFVVLQDAAGAGRSEPELAATIVVTEAFVGTQAGTSPARYRGYGAPPPPPPRLTSLNFFTVTALVSGAWLVLVLAYLGLRTVVVGERPVPMPASVRAVVAHRPTRRQEFVVAGVGFVLLAVVLTWPLTKHLASHVTDRGDPLFTSWILAWGADSFPSASVFHAPMFSPERWTLAISENLLGLAVPLAPLWYLTRNAVLLNNVALLTSFALNGCFAYLLARELGAGRVGSVIAGIVFAFAPYRMAQLSHVHVEATFFMPLVFLALLRFVRGPDRRWGLLVGALFLAQAWTSLNAGVVTAVGVALLLPFVVAATEPRLRRRAMLHLGAGALVAVIGLLPLVFAFAQARDSNTPSRADVSYHAADARSLLVVPARHALLGRSTEHLRTGAWPEKALYPGVVVVGLAVAGAWRLRRQRLVVGAAATLVVAAGVLAFGPGGDGIGLPFNWLRAVVPGFDQLRVPTRFWPLALLGLGVLASHGLPRVRRFAATVVGLLVLELLAFPAMQPAPDVPEVYDWLSRRGGTVMELPALDLADLGRSIERETTALYRQTVHGSPLANGYSAFAPPSYLELLEATSTFPSEGARRALVARDVRWLVIDTASLDGTPWWGIDVRVDDDQVAFRSGDHIVVEVR